MTNNIFKPALWIFFLLFLNLARAQSWREINPPHNLFNAGIYSLDIDAAGVLYASGQFKNEKNEFIVATWNGSGWVELGSESGGLKANNIISNVAHDSKGNIYAAGGFTNSTGNYSVAKWDGAAWSEVGGLSNALKPNGIIYAMAIDDSDHIYVAGGMTNGADKNYVAKWDGTAWKELASTTSTLDGNGIIYSLAIGKGGVVYAAGHLTNSSGKYYVARWKDSTWTELGATAPLNANGHINCVTTDATGNVYAGGDFRNAAGEYYVAKWDGNNWSEVGSGASALKANGPINALALNAAGHIYAGGFGTNYMGNTHLVRWDGTTWSEVFDVPYSLSDAIRAICLDKDGNVYAAGDFTNNGGHQYVAKWDGQKVSEPGRFGEDLEIHNGIDHMTVDSRGEVYVVGAFMDPSGYDYIAHWNGTTWARLGGDTASLKVNHGSLAMTTDHRGNLYVTGDFKNKDGNYYIAKWDGHSWSEVENPASPVKIFAPIYLLTTDHQGNLYAGGSFGEGSMLTSSIMKWDGTNWTLYPYLNGGPASLYVDKNGNIYAGSSVRDENFKYYVDKITLNGVTRLGSGATALNSGSRIQFLSMDGKGNLLAGGWNNEGSSAYNNFVAKWDGTRWSPAGSNTGPYAEGYLEQMISDTSGNVYVAAATIHNSQFSVAKWDGNEWSELGTGANSLNANSNIGCLAIDVRQNIYAAGLFGNENGKNYVAVYGNSPLFLQQPELSGIAAQYCGSSNSQVIKVTNLPPAGWISARAALDNSPLAINSDSMVAFTPSSLSPGKHRLQVTYSTRVDSLFTVKDIVTTVAATPIVNMAASATTVINNDPVLVTASNASGGGTTPRYTFARNRTLSTILQAESTSNTISVNPVDLSAGENWIYVQMRTSETCYTTAVGMDSIMITKTTTTGLRDLDQPGGAIFLYPVPSRGQFTLNGLQSAKTYVVTIVNAVGQKVYERKVSHSNSTNIYLPGAAKGALWLTLYDQTKKRRIGTIPLLKE